MCSAMNLSIVESTVFSLISVPQSAPASGADQCVVKPLPCCAAAAVSMSASDDEAELALLEEIEKSQGAMRTQ